MATPITVTFSDNGSGVLLGTTAAAHGMPVDERCSFTDGAGVLPNTLTQYTHYQVNSVPATTTFTLKPAGGGTPIAYAAPTSTNSLFPNPMPDMPFGAKACSFDITTERVTEVAHGRQVGDAVIFGLTAGGSMAGNVTEGRLYFMESIYSVDEYKIAQSFGAAALAMDTSNGSGAYVSSGAQTQFGDQALTISNVPTRAKIEIGGMVEGSRWRLSLASDITKEIGTGVADATGLASAITLQRGLARLDVRKGTSAPKYLPYVTFGTISDDGLSFYVTQIPDTIAA